jgi:uncharacterized protein
VNVWLALTYERHVHHVAAGRWFQRLDPEAQLCFCRFTQISLLRLLNTGAVMGSEVMNQADAWSAYDQWIDSGVAVLIDEPAGLERIFRDYSQQTKPAPKDWADSYLTAFASVSGVRLVTFDRSFAGRHQDAIILRN